IRTARFGHRRAVVPSHHHAHRGRGTTALTIADGIREAVITDKAGGRCVSDDRTTVDNYPMRRLGHIGKGERITVWVPGQVQHIHGDGRIFRYYHPHVARLGWIIDTGHLQGHGSDVREHAATLGPVQEVVHATEMGVGYVGEATIRIED